MGAQTFVHRIPRHEAENPIEAFDRAVTAAQYDYGHAGYTGTIAEKFDFVMIELPENEDIYQFITQLIDKGDPRIDDKWGPAGCIDHPEHGYVFFGWASS